MKTSMMASWHKYYALRTGKVAASPEGGGESESNLNELEPFRADVHHTKAETSSESSIHHLKQMQERTQRMLELSEEKLALAISTYDTVDRHIRRLDNDLLKNERSLHAGLRRELTESSDGTQVQQTPVPMDSDRFSPDGQLLTFWSGLISLSPLTCLAYLKEFMQKTKDEAMRAKRASPAADVIRDADIDVEPSEPRYCYCNRVSYGEVC